jgi:hypothetical protein
MRRCERQRTAGERQPVGDKLCTERGQESVGAGHAARFIDQPSENGRQLHEEIILRPAPVSAILLRTADFVIQGASDG